MKVLAIGNENRELKGGWFLADELELAKLNTSPEWNVIYELDNAWTDRQTMVAVWVERFEKPTIAVLRTLIREFEERCEKNDQMAAECYEECDEKGESYFQGVSFGYRAAANYIRTYISEVL